MYLRFNDKKSPDFGHVDDDTLDVFFDWAGGDGADEEIFWNAHVWQDGDAIVLSSETPFPDPQRVVDAIAEHLGVQISPYLRW